jgi:hypothetical protein
MNWKSAQFWTTLGAVLCGALVSFGVLKPDESTAASGALAQIAGGVLTLVGVIAGVRARRSAAKPPAPAAGNFTRGTAG